LAEIKLKQLSEDGDRKLSILKQAIDQQLRLANDNLIKSENKAKDLLERFEKAQASKIQEVKD
jgi:cell division GTPase FtsZ